MEWAAAGHHPKSSSEFNDEAEFNQQRTINYK